MKTYLQIGCLAALAAVLSSCTTVTVYQSPVADFQSSVVAANNGIRTYLLGVNDVIAKGNLYDEINAGQPWSPKDLSGGIPDREIQVRLQALDTIAAYANALGAIAQSKDVANLQQAASTLGTNLNSLAGTITAIRDDAQSKPQTKQLAVDIGAPVSAFVSFFGTIAIQNAQKHALDKAILGASTNVDALIEKLKVTMPDFAALMDTSENAIWQGKFRVYQQLAKSASPKDVDALINQCVADFDALQKLRHAQVTSLLDAMEDSHQALVAFAKSDKNPKDLFELSARINLFASQVQLFNTALAALQQTINPPR